MTMGRSRGGGSVDVHAHKTIARANSYWSHLRRRQNQSRRDWKRMNEESRRAHRCPDEEAGRAAGAAVVVDRKGSSWVVRRLRGGRPRVLVEIVASPTSVDPAALASNRCCSRKASRRKFAASHRCRRTGAEHGTVRAKWSVSDSSRKIHRSGEEAEPGVMAGKQTTTTLHLLPPRCRSKRTKPRERWAGDRHWSLGRQIEDETTTKRRKKKKEARLMESEEEGCCSCRTSCGGCGENRTPMNHQDRRQSASRTIHTRHRDRIAPSKSTEEEAAVVPSASGDN